MIEDPDTLLKDFIGALARIGINCYAIGHESQTAPHQPHSLPTGKCAVYVFSLSESCGRGCPCGPNKVLKVGKAGPKSNARFQSQHYHPNSARSTLAQSLLSSPILWRYLGISTLDEGTIANWIKHNTDRDNFYLDAEEMNVCGALEKYLRARLGPVFEGG